MLRGVPYYKTHRQTSDPDRILRTDAREGESEGEKILGRRSTDRKFVENQLFRSNFTYRSEVGKLGN